MDKQTIILGAALAAGTATVAGLGYYAYRNSGRKEDRLEVSLIVLKSLLKDPIEDLTRRATLVSWFLYTDLEKKGRADLVDEWRGQGSRRKIYQVEEAKVMTELESQVLQLGFPMITMENNCSSCDHLYTAMAIGPTCASDMGQLLTKEIKLIAEVDLDQEH